MALRVVFADDNYLVREGVSALLAEAEDIELVDVVADPERCSPRWPAHSPDAVLTDIRMPPTHTDEGIEAAKTDPRRAPRASESSSSRSTSRRTTPSTCCPRGSPGMGYLLKERVSDLDELVRALRRGGSRRVGRSTRWSSRRCSPVEPVKGRCWG